MKKGRNGGLRICGIALMALALAACVMVLAPEGARAANVDWNSGTPPTTFVTGDTVIVTSNAKGELVIPDDVDTLTIVGPGMNNSVTDANILISNTGDVDLTIKNLDMTAPAGAYNAIRADAVTSLTLELTDVSLTGGGNSALGTVFTCSPSH